MQYLSTRDSALRVSAQEAIVRGLAPQSGLFVPETFPQADLDAWKNLSYPELAEKVLAGFLTDYSADFLHTATASTYGAAFGGKAGETVKVRDGLYSLELWHGPTCAFKDYALQLMPKLLVEAKKNLSRTEKTLILVATSGDTGKAALDGYHDIPGVEIAVFYPTGGTSEIQRLQMATQEGANVAVYAVRGNFDDAQTGVKKVFVRSGIRYDYLLEDKGSPFLSELVKYHISGQLKVAPEHCVAGVLDYMGKPHFDVFEKFWDKYRSVNEKNGREQYLVPYLMSSHPGCTLEDAVQLAEFLHSTGHKPEQVQDFYPSPGTVSTCMFYTGLDPYTLKPVFVEKTAEGKALQRALLQYYEPRNAEKVIKALKMTHREDLIPLLVPAEGRIAVQRSARRAEAADVTIHGDGTYTVRPRGKGGKPQSRSTAPAGRSPAGRQPSPGARFAPHSAPAHKPKSNQQKENTSWKTSKKKK